MTLLTICQEVARDIPIEVPNQVFGNDSDETAKLLYSSANRAGKWLSTRTNWVDMVKEYTFSTVASQEDYDLPSDFKFIVNDTLWDRSNYESIRGPLNPQEWQRYQSSVLADTITTWKRYRIRDVSGTKKFSIHPVPDAVENLVFEYLSTSWCESAASVGQNAWLADSDTGVIDEELIYLETRWRVLNRLGLSYAEEKQEARTQIDIAVSREGGAKKLNLSSSRNIRLLGPENVPDTGFGA